MIAPGDQRRTTRPIAESDVVAGFRCGKHALDDYFARHALPNDAAGINRAFVLPRAEGDKGLPAVLGFYTLSMAMLESSLASAALKKRLPGYPMPVALIGRLAVHENARRQGLGELLLVDAFTRVLALLDQIGCVGIVVDA